MINHIAQISLKIRQTKIDREWHYMSDIITLSLNLLLNDGNYKRILSLVIVSDAPYVI